MITAFASVETAVRALKQGAFDYVTKPIDPDELSHLVRRAIEQRRLEHENDAAEASPSKVSCPVDAIVGESATMQKVLELVRHVAKTDATVLDPRGERHRQGTDRPRHAREQRPPLLSHRSGQLRRDPREPARERVVRSREGRVHRRAVPAQGQDRDGGRRHAVPRRGRRHSAEDAGGSAARARDQGVDPPRRQPRGQGGLPRGVRDQRRPGEGRPGRARSARTSTSASTSSRSRSRRCASGGRTFPLLARHFVERFARQMDKRITGISPAAMELLVAHDWPGNVRELSNAIERAMVVGTPPEIRPERPAAADAARGGCAAPATCRSRRSSGATSPTCSSAPAGTSAARPRSSRSIARRSTTRSSATASSGRTHEGASPAR